MKKIYFFICLLVSITAISQDGAPAAPYYNGFNWTITGQNLKNALSTKIIDTHTNFLSYTPGVWEASKITDLDPTDATNTNVLLLYGFSNNICPTSTSDDNDHRRRNKDSNGGNNTCEWNREHVYAKSLGTPALDDAAPSDAGEDAHHLRASDVQRNGARGNRKFAAGSGNSGNVGADWYPGDEWKGDVARMMMYMYLRYPSQCLPINVGTGATVANDPNMLNLFLQWNAEDPVSQYEDNRNTYHDSNGTYAQGNRNPFIDNPYLATVIWGGTPAQNRWPSVFLSTNEFVALERSSVYPNPSNTNSVNLYSEVNIEEIQIINLNGQLIQIIKNSETDKKSITVNNLPQGFYLLKLRSGNAISTKKVIIN
ncbi:endonuclease [Flavobacterium terrae]|uniref:Por secretion system C-terminal sorting domain-containing protein n=1 Tax=Flavobacterium terrae TaxID=415425 RepID=A0A1M6GXH6_9FLAO|nr:endonuclease [Flavobacterium terrae]SHJ14688.1 Por secretion system C-terminal sorting domain-containing protein [Flavobacterium terrae]